MNSHYSQFTSDVRALLDSHRGTLIEHLRQLTSAPLEPDIAYLHFEFEINPDGTGFPLLVALSKAGNEVYSDSRRTLFVDMPFTIPPKLNPVRSECEFEEASEVWEEVLFPWFQECWVEIGGLSYSVPASISERWDTEAFDLKTGEWIRAR